MGRSKAADFALVRTQRAVLAAPAVGAYRRGLLVHQLHRFANPAVTIGGFIVMQLLGQEPMEASSFIVELTQQNLKLFARI